MHVQVANAKDFVKFVNLEMNDIRKSFIKIGFRLNEAKNLDYRYYLKYDTFEQMCESEFGFKKSTAYNFIKVWECFHDGENKMCINPYYEKFDFSKLLEITKFKDNYKCSFMKIIQPSDTVLNIRKFIEICNEYYTTKRFTSSIFGNTVSETIENYNNLPKNEEENGESLEETFQTSGKIEDLPEVVSSKLDKVLKNYKLVYDPFNSLDVVPKMCSITESKDFINLICGKDGYINKFIKDIKKN